MKDESKDLALRLKHGYRIDILCQSCLFYDEAKNCTTPVPIQYQAVGPGQGMVSCSNYLMRLYKPGQGTSEESYSDRLVNLWTSKRGTANITTGKMRPNKQRTIAKTKHGRPEVISENLLLEIKTNYLKMKGAPTRNLKLRHSMAKFLLRLVIEDRRRMAHIDGYGWYVDPLGPMMSDYLGNELQRIVEQLERK